MKKNTFYKISIILSIIALILTILATLSLLDILHGIEPDFTQEWAIVKLALLVVFITLHTNISAIIKSKGKNA